MNFREFKFEWLKWLKIRSFYRDPLYEQKRQIKSYFYEKEKHPGKINLLYKPQLIKSTALH